MTLFMSQKKVKHQNLLIGVIRKKISNRIYKVVSFSKNQIFFIPHFVSEPIIQTIELGSNNKAERDWYGNMIKNNCIKLKVDRLGNITPAI